MCGGASPSARDSREKVEARGPVEARDFPRRKGSKMEGQTSIRAHLLQPCSASHELTKESTIMCVFMTHTHPHTHTGRNTPAASCSSDAAAPRQRARHAHGDSKRRQAHNTDSSCGKPTASSSTCPRALATSVPTCAHQATDLRQALPAARRSSMPAQPARRNALGDQGYAYDRARRPGMEEARDARRQGWTAQAALPSSTRPPSCDT